MPFHQLCTASFLWTSSSPFLATVVAILIGIIYLQYKHGYGSLISVTKQRQEGLPEEGHYTGANFRDLKTGRRQQPSHELLEESFSIPCDMAVELGEMVELSIKAFVNSWYQYMSDDTQLPEDIRQSLTYALGSLFSRLRSLHVLSFAADKVLLAIQLHLHWYFKMKALAIQHNPKVFSSTTTSGTLTDEQYRCLLKEFQDAEVYHEGVFDTVRAMRRQNYQYAMKTPGGPLLKDSDDSHASSSSVGGNGGPILPPPPAATGDVNDSDPFIELMLDPEGLKKAEQGYLRSLSAALMKLILLEEDWKCRMVRHLCREVFACRVLFNATSGVSPDAINCMIAAAIKGFVPPSPEVETTKPPNPYIPGVAPAGFPTEASKGWRHFAGQVTRQEAEQLLSQQKPGCFVFRRVGEKVSDDTFELVYVHAERQGKPVLRSAALCLKPQKYEYAERDAFYYENIFDLVDGQPTLDDLLEAISPIASEGMVFEPPPTPQPTLISYPLLPQGSPIRPPGAGSDGSQTILPVQDGLGVPEAIKEEPEEEDEIDASVDGEEVVCHYGEVSDFDQPCDEEQPSQVQPEPPQRIPSYSELAELDHSASEKITAPLTPATDQQTVKPLFSPSGQSHLLIVQEARNVKLIELQAAIEQILEFVNGPSVAGKPRLISIGNNDSGGVDAARRVLRSLVDMLRYGVKDPNMMDSGTAWFNLVAVRPQSTEAPASGEKGLEKESSFGKINEAEKNGGQRPLIGSVVKNQTSGPSKVPKSRTSSDEDDSFVGGKWFSDNLANILGEGSRRNSLPTMAEKPVESIAESVVEDPQGPEGLKERLPSPAPASDDKDVLLRGWRSFRSGSISKQPSASNLREEKKKEEATSVPFALGGLFNISKKKAEVAKTLLELLVEGLEQGILSTALAKGYAMPEVDEYYEEFSVVRDQSSYAR